MGVAAVTVVAWLLLPVLALAAFLVLLAAVDDRYPRSLPRRPLPYPRRIPPLAAWSNRDRRLLSPVWPYLRRGAGGRALSARPQDQAPESPGPEA